MAKQNTGILRYGNAIERKGWMVEGMIQKASESFWRGLTGNSADAIVYQKNDFRAKVGHNIIFDYSGNLATAGFRGKEQAFGNSPAKMKFSDSLTLEFGRYTVDNGMEFDAEAIGDIDLSTHADSREKLADNFVRAKDQMFFDLGQGYLRGQAPSHIIRPNGRANIGALTAGDKLSWDFLVQLETTIKTGIGYTVGSRRSPMKPFKLADGRKVWLLVLDAFQIADLLEDEKFQRIYQHAEVRGIDNALISHNVTQVGSFVIVEASTFAGMSINNKLFKTAVEIQGLRTIDEHGVFSGTGKAHTGKVASRGLVLGAGAFQLGMGHTPDYKFQESQDFGITSESAVLLTMQADKCRLTAETEDYKEAKVANMDYSVAVIDTFNAKLSN
jgi:hypothetical protein